MKLPIKSAKTVFFLGLSLLLLVAPLYGNTHANSDDILQKGIDSFQEGQYETATEIFQQLIEDSQNQSRRADAYFWAAKTYMALGALATASSYLEYFIHNFSNHYYIEEANYQRGRIFYLQADYNNAIQSLSHFAEKYRDSAFVPNAHYWNAESLFQMGQLADARSMFQIVVHEYPRSYRSEAAAYRLSIIDLYEREAVLLDLLADSHQELLYIIEYYEHRERQYIETIESQARQLQGQR